jgi:hypothetical protein
VHDAPKTPPIVNEDKENSSSADGDKEGENSSESESNEEENNPAETPEEPNYPEITDVLFTPGSTETHKLRTEYAVKDIIVGTIGEVSFTISLKNNKSSIELDNANFKHY